MASLSGQTEKDWLLDWVKVLHPNLGEPAPERLNHCRF